VKTSSTKDGSKGGKILPTNRYTFLANNMNKISKFLSQDVLYKTNFTPSPGYIQYSLSQIPSGEVDIGLQEDAGRN